jgi:hypothetical protein
LKKADDEIQREISSSSDFDVLTRAQYYDPALRRREAESRLLFAVLEDAIRCVICTPRSSTLAKRRELCEALAWINKRGDYHLFSFDSICGVLEIDAEALRRELNSSKVPNLGTRRFGGVGRKAALSVPRR